ncbi:hypothetical protein PM082_024465 [Marasmius tenuissimus]|nr:hypothetical protein PM082_024465 [Marasmius tenuissimus]
MERSTPAWETNGLGCVWGIAYSHREYFGDGFRRASGNLHETILLRNEGQAEAGHRMHVRSTIVKKILRGPDMRN